MSRTKIVRGWTNRRTKLGPRAAVFGSFDGLHLGHHALIDELVRWKTATTNSEAWLISLYPHPGTILKGRQVKQIISLSQNVKLLSDYGVDYWQLLRFTTRVSEMSAHDFIECVFINLCQLDHLIVGPDAAVGKNRAGNIDLIRSELARQGCQVTVLPELQLGGAKIGSRYIRAAIEAGDPARAQELLGRPFIIEGKVRRGASRGRQVGYRTANIDLGNYVVPAFGVYLVRAGFGGKLYPAVANVGVRPTFGASEPVLEVHLLDYSGPDFYKERVAVEFIRRLRPEKKFSNLENLRTQIGLDVEAAREYFSRESF